MRGDAGCGSEVVILISRRGQMQEDRYDLGRTRVFVLIGPVARGSILVQHGGWLEVFGAGGGRAILQARRWYALPTRRSLVT